jgi:hypothetical protein
MYYLQLDSFLGKAIFPVVICQGGKDVDKLGMRS